MKRFYIFAVICLAMLLGFAPKAQAQTIWDGSIDLTWYDADQSSFDISTPAQLAGVAQLVNAGIANFNGKTLNLTADIWLNSTGDSTNNWVPIGGSATATGEDASSGYSFRGAFNGHGHAIYNLYCEKTNYFHAGLFGCVQNPCTIDSVVMFNPILKSKGMMGAFVGMTRSGGVVYIRHCLVINGRLQGTGGNNIGFMVGANYPNSSGTQIQNCGATGTVSGNYPGGMGGNGQYTTWTNCYFVGTVTVTGSNNDSGNFTAHQGTLNNCYACANITYTVGGKAGTPKTQAEMQSPDIITLLGSAFKMDNGINNGYPIMSYMAGVDPVEAEICTGESITLTAFGYESYLWSTGATTESITVSPTTTTTYTVTGTMSGASYVLSSTVTVHPSATITVEVVASSDGQTHGTVTPTTTSVPCGSSDNVTITITPDVNWHISRITLNGETLREEDPSDGAVVPFTFNPGGTLATVKVFFSNKYSITTTTVLDDGTPLNVSGLVSPWGTNGVYSATQGDSVVYSFNETAVYHVTDVTIDDMSYGVISSYTFYDVAGPHAITVTYGACGPVVNLAVSQVMGTSAMVTWDAPSVGTLVDYTLEYKEANDADWTTINNLSVTQYLLSGLTPQGAYQVRVKTTCDNALEGGWVTKSFNTPCLLGGDVAIGEGTSTTSYFPTYSCYNYALTEQVFTSAELGGANTFHSISFNISSTASNPNRSWDIYLMPTTVNSVSSFVSVDTTIAIKVFSGTVNLTTGWNTVYFTTPFVFDGSSNLMLIMDDNTTTYSCSNYFYYTSTPSGVTSVYAYNDYTDFDPLTAGTASYSSYTASYRCNVIFGGECDSLVTCIAPNMMIADITENSAEVQWVPGYMESNWNLEYKLDSDTDWTFVSAVTGSSFILSGLNPNTKYNVRLQSDCGSEVSPWTVATFRTECGPITQIPYSENFEDASAIYSTSQNNYYLCWNRYASDPEHYVYISGNTTYAHSGSHFMDFHHTNNCYNIGIMPAIDPSFAINTLMVSFWACKSGTSGTLEVGVMTDYSDASTFEPVDTIDLSEASTYQYVEQFVKFENYQGSGNYIAFRVSNAVSCGYYIDDIVLDYSPECSQINSLEVVETTGSSALIEWTDGPFGTVNSYTLEYSEAGQESWTSVNVVDTTSYLLEGLEPSTYYDVRVMVNCDGSLSSDWVTITFHTNCLVGGDVTIGDGTAAFSYLPSYGFYNYSYTQQLFLASELGGPKGIESVTFDMTNYAVNRTYKIYLMHTTATDAGSWIPASTAQLVFDAPQQLVQGLNTFQFSTPFQYNGSDNLLLIVLDMTGSYSSGNTWKTHTAPFTASRYIYQDGGAYTTSSAPSSGSGGSTSSRNNVIFGAGCDTTVHCVAPHIAIGALGQTTATINWVAGYQESSWVMEYRPQSDTVWTTIGTVTSMSEVISGLTPNTTYKVRMRSDCGNEFSYWTEATFTTACGALTITATDPWTEGFEGYTGNNPISLVCWDTPVTFTADNGTFPAIWGNWEASCHTGANSVEMKGSHNLLVLPEFTNSIQELRLSFWATTTHTSDYGTMEVGVITNVNDTSTFVVLGPAGVPGPRNSSSHVSGNGNYMGPFDFNNMQITTGRLALRFTHTATGVSWNLDDFIVQLIPNCPSPDKTSVTASNVGAHTATISFTDGDASHNSWTVYYKKSTDNTWLSVVTSTTSVDLTNLDPESTYDVYVVTNCSTTDPVEDATNTIHFTTTIACPAPTGLAVSNVGMTTATLSWQGTASSYIITCGSDNYTSTTNSVDLMGLTAGTTYNVTVQSDCGLEGTSSSASFTFTTALCDVANQCAYTFILTDGYGDGWNYASINILQNGIQVDQVEAINHGLFNTTTIDTIQVYLCNNQPTTLTWNSGNFDSECGVMVVGPDGTAIYTSSGTPSDTLTTFTTDCGGPAITDPTVTTATATGVSTTAATLNATITNPDNVTISAKGFEWKATMGGTYAPVVGTGSGNAFSATLSNLSPNTGYTYKAFITYNGTTVYGDEMTFTTQEQQQETCPAPTNLTATLGDPSHTTVTLTWQQEANTANEWQINYRQTTENTWSTVTANATTYTLTDLVANVDYEVKVEAHCTNGLTSDPSNTVTFHTDDVGIQGYLEKSVNLYPNPATEMISVAVSDANIMITGVEVYNVYGQLINTIISTENPLRINVSGLADGMYYVRVTTDNGVVTKNFVKR